ncbi:MarR family winged helix-turn-helix transcriptional regulator [Amycolatopsis suaedae]|uniref:MarR family winged helix-turn-helix transcriptional regulator n=1 Tax=Amycolatopsis suaedae TaxID=2510978 RepID=UPI00196B48E6|nr:MarR family transcriptional regulator [Amycolatopsis suaedae]
MRHKDSHDWLAGEIGAAAESLVLAWARGEEQAHGTVSVPQLRALFAVDAHGPLTVGRLGTLLDALPSSASRLCDRLEATGLLARQAGASDRRATTVSLTPAGRELLDDVRRARQRHLGEILAAMSPEQRTALLEGLTEFARAAARANDD